MMITMMRCYMLLLAIVWPLAVEGQSTTSTVDSTIENELIAVDDDVGTLDAKECANHQTFGSATATKVYNEVIPSVVTVWSGQAYGTGVIISDDGLVLTCDHVIRNDRGGYTDDTIYVLLSDKRLYRATIKGNDEIIDVVILQLLLDDIIGRGQIHNFILRQISEHSEWFGWDLPSSIGWDDPLSVARFGNSSTTQVGTQILSIGYSFSYGPEATAGIVSGFWHDQSRIVRSIMTDTPCFRGFSGGPIVDIENGSVIGIHRLVRYSMAKAKEGNSDYLLTNQRCVSIPIDSIKELLPSMIEGKNIKHGTIGVHLISLSKDIPQGSLIAGAEITKIDNGSPATRGRKKLRPKDVIVAINGTEVENAVDARKLIDQAAIGKKLEVTVMRKQKTKVTVTVKPEAMKEEDEKSTVPLVNLWNYIRKYLMGLF